MAKDKVTANQFFMLLYLSLLSTVFMYLSSPHIKLAQTDTLLRPIVFVAVSLLVGVPAFLISKRNNELLKNRQYIPKTVVLKIIAILYAVVYFVGILKTIARFDLFASSELFPDADMFIFLMVIIAVCALLSLTGLGALARASVIFLLIVGLSTAVVMASLHGEIDIFNFTPIFSEGVPEFLKDSLLFAMQATEIGAIAIFTPEITGNIKKSFVSWTVLSALSFSLIFFFVVGSLGSFADTQLFPTYTAVSLASFGLLERVDALETAIWIICVVEKSALYFLIVSKSLKYAFGGVSQKRMAILTAFFVAVLTGIGSYDIQKFTFLSDEKLTAVLFLLATVLLPVAVAIYIRRVKPCEKADESI